MTCESQHPGGLVRTLCLEAFGLTVTEGARCLGVTRQALNNVVNRRAGISPEMAVRLDKVFGGGAEVWLQRQLVFDLRQARAKADKWCIQPLQKARRPALSPDGAYVTSAAQAAR
jgi:addiction module HigA family antidote